MNNQAWPWPFVEYLIQCFDLNECEAADLSDWAQQHLDADLGKNISSRGRVVDQLWVRAENLAVEGSLMQPIWDTVQRAALTNPHKT